MITLEQIRLLESKIARAIELIRVLKEENSTLRKGLESAQKRMKELESLVDGFKSDQNEIESVIVRTLHNLDELEENVAGRHQERVPGSSARTDAAPRAESSSRTETPSRQEPAARPAPPAASSEPQRAEIVDEGGVRVVKEELDIF
jgi:peptidoglycan hydrolase CwlO-like protein